jgi:hypothetical protein
MGKKVKLSPDEIKQVEKALTAVGEEGYSFVPRGAIPERLTDVLLRELKPSTRVKIARRLIELALGDANKISLDAIKEIYDRTEGKALASLRSSRLEDDPLISIYREVFADDTKLYTPAVYRLLTDE